MTAATDQPDPGVDVAEQLLDAPTPPVGPSSSSYVDVGAPPVSPPPSWVQAVRELEPELPALMVDPAMADEIDGELQLHPWEPCGDVAALLAWARHMTGLVTVWRSPSSMAAVTVRGTLADHPTRLVGTSHFLDGAYSQYLDVHELGRIAVKEARARRVDAPPGPAVDPGAGVYATATAVLEQETVAVGDG